MNSIDSKNEVLKDVKDFMLTLNPAGLTYENWIKTSTLIEEYMALARDRRNDRPKSTKQLNDEHSQWLSQRLSKTQKPTQRKEER